MAPPCIKDKWSISPSMSWVAEVGNTARPPDRCAEERGVAPLEFGTRPRRADGMRNYTCRRREHVHRYYCACNGVFEIVRDLLSAIQISRRRGSQPNLAGRIRKGKDSDVFKMIACYKFVLRATQIPIRLFSQLSGSHPKANR